MPQPLSSPEFGTYSPEDVLWLLSDVSDYQLEGTKEDREIQIQSNMSHYSESLPIEYQPPQQYLNVFNNALEDQGENLALNVARLTRQIVHHYGPDVVLVSLARAGVPAGILIKRLLKQWFSLDIPHYAISIIRGKGIDHEALKYIHEHHDVNKVVFIDGWTGKGAITKELVNALDDYYQETGIKFPTNLGVIADTGACADFYGTRQDALIPSACLNSTVSGLISRTVLRSDIIKPGMFHGAKFYRELVNDDVSYVFIDAVTKFFKNIPFVVAVTDDDERNDDEMNSEPVSQSGAGFEVVQRIAKEYDIPTVNLVKPGIGETTRVLLRRVPWMVIIRDGAETRLLQHILMLAFEKDVRIVYRNDIAPYDCIGIINPKYDKSATGDNGEAV